MTRIDSQFLQFPLKFSYFLSIYYIDRNDRICEALQNVYRRLFCTQLFVIYTLQNFFVSILSLCRCTKCDSVWTNTQNIVEVDAFSVHGRRLLKFQRTRTPRMIWWLMFFHHNRNVKCQSAYPCQSLYFQTIDGTGHPEQWMYHFVWIRSIQSPVECTIQV